MDNFKNFTIKNNIYEGNVSPHTVNYKSLGEIIWTKIKIHGNKIIHLDACTDKEVTFAELQDKIIRCAIWLQEQGIKSGDVVTVCTHNHLNSIVPCLAGIYINAVFNPWYENMDFQTALHVMQLTTPKIIFCNEKSINSILNAIKECNFNPIVVVFGKHPEAISFSDILNMYNDVADFRYVDPDNIKQTACIVHSSGIGGMPKGIEISHYSLLLSLDNKIMDIFDALLTNAVSIWFTSLYWWSGIIMNLKAIVTGSKVIIYPEFDEKMTCRLIEKYRVTEIFLNTSMLNRFHKTGDIQKNSLSSLKMLISTGSILKSEIQEDLKRILPHSLIFNGYGMTELGTATFQFPHHKNGSCGTVAENVQMKVVDLENEKVVGPNNSGELWIKTASIMNGYYRNPEATKSAIDEEGWFHSGDIGYFDDDGELFITDRMKELIKYRGYHISPGKIESVLMSHPAVLEVAVIGVPYAEDDEHPVAFVTKIPGAKVTEQELIDLVANNMMDQYKLRAGVIFLDVFPYTGSGKIARRELKAIAKKLVVN